MVWSRSAFLHAAGAAGSLLASFPLRAAAQEYAPPYSLGGALDLGNGGQLRSIHFAPERGSVPVECLAAILPPSFSATILDVGELRAGYSAVVDLARNRDAAVAINGGFFTEPFNPDGLLIVDGRTLGRARSDYSTAIAVDRDGTLSLVPTANALRASSAVQGHPRLVESGGKMGMHSEAGDRAERTFVAQSGTIIIAGVTSPVTLYHLADILVQYPDAFGRPRIDSAVNLSGSATTSFYARLPDGSEVIRRASWPNRDVLLFKPRLYVPPSAPTT